MDKDSFYLENKFHDEHKKKNIIDEIKEGANLSRKFKNKIEASK